MKPFTFPPTDSDYFSTSDSPTRKALPAGDFIHIQAIDDVRLWVRFGNSSVDADDADGSIVIHGKSTIVFRRPSDSGVTHVSFVSFGNGEAILFGTF